MKQLKWRKRGNLHTAKHGNYILRVGLHLLTGGYACQVATRGKKGLYLNHVETVEEGKDKCTGWLKKKYAHIRRKKDNAIKFTCADWCDIYAGVR